MPRRKQEALETALETHTATDTSSEPVDESARSTATLNANPTEVDSVAVLRRDVSAPASTPPEVSAERASSPPESQPGDSETTAGTVPKHWGNPYKAIFTCPEQGFELGENRRFKQRVFYFNETPDAAKMATLKEQGFTYRGEEKAWTIPADAVTRKLTDELAREWAGPNYVRGMER